MTVDAQMGIEIKNRIICGSDKMPDNELHEIQTLSSERLKLLNGEIDNVFSKKYFSLTLHQETILNPLKKPLSNL